ncbi:type IX secretion system membrane protein PorP/SprF [Litoribacter ruber]|uniref:Type IX secretion system membrane protein PorP/SprF n=1 Tax=Litoribacter ruber TaxID=702568 RepID=A0AAP2CN61_9BACT|nr:MULTISPECIES: type IX secretion system membrane protein PorP/SprF [Litoribacter]MBS9524832.1 type IX secretion system membrane protein PorP/SprF [Litoribacter alkaliphilus]MBT0812585.1 type IX secretion system membrane protein PorP/SprF [Litoribacter ruber]
MKKYLLILCFVIVSSHGFAQSRKYFTQFNSLQGYYNPALTAHGGSALRGVVRNQWMGLDGSPSSTFFSGEIDFAELSGEDDPALMGRNAVGANVLFDQHGPFAETELNVNYATRVRLSAKHSFRLGAGVNFSSVRLDGASLTPELENDPTIGKYLGGFADMQSLDFHIGGALTHERYYLGFAMNNVNGGKFNRGDVFWPQRPIGYVISAGYRESLSDQLSVMGNALYRYQDGLYDNIEFNFKALFADTFWLGGGHRIDHGNNFQFGVLLLHQFTVGYVFEFPTNASHRLPGTTHEFVATLRLGRTHIRRDRREILIW